MTLTDLIGNTPLIDLSAFMRKSGVSLYAKAEWMNPGGSIKDRPVKRMLTRAIASGKLTKDKIIIDSSSGNAGIAYAMIGGALGHRVHIVIPGNASRERLNRLKAHGAKIILTDPLEGYDEAVRTVHRIYENKPDTYFFADQYANDDNWRAHYEETAVELISQVGKPIDHFVCGVGTGGTITGIGRRLKEVFPGVTIWCIKPEVFPGIEGLKPLGSPEDIVPKIFDDSVVDEWVEISSAEAQQWCRKLGRSGWFVGQSSGAYLSACSRVAGLIKSGVMVTLLKDLGERYFSAGLWEQGVENAIAAEHY